MDKFWWNSRKFAVNWAPPKQKFGNQKQCLLKLNIFKFRINHLTLKVSRNFIKFKWQSQLCEGENLEVAVYASTLISLPFFFFRSAIVCIRSWIPNQFLCINVFFVSHYTFTSYRGLHTNIIYIPFLFTLLYMRVKILVC